MEAISQESLVSPKDIHEAPISITTTEANLTGSWKFFRPAAESRVSPCSSACPLHINIPEYMEKAAEKKTEEAVEIIRRSNPLPAVTGRVCPRFCQQDCSRRNLDQEVLIGSIEQYLGDAALKIPFRKPEKKVGKKVCIIGSGPAGLSAAYFLAEQGCVVDMLEKEAEPGGLLRYGIPEYRLPKDILAQEINNLLDSYDINIYCSHEASTRDLPDLLRKYDSLFCAPGLGASRSLEELPESERVCQALELLKRINSGEVPEYDQYVVIGGGNAAVDAARSLIRLGKKVRIVYRRTRQEMPAYKEEIEQALEEGVELREQRVVREAVQRGEDLELIICGAVNREGRISAGREFERISTRAVVLAIGQKEHMQIPGNIPHLHTGGDYNSGPATVVQAMAQGRSAARKILAEWGLSRVEPEHKCLKADPAPDSFILLKKEAEISRPGPGADARSRSFAEVNPAIPEETMLEAASRCLQCGTCTGCGICWYFCPDAAIRIKESGGVFRVEIDLEHCKGCGLCAALCPRGVITMQEDR